MTRYKLNVGSHTIGKVTYKAKTNNDILELTEEQANQLGDRIMKMDFSAASIQTREVKNSSVVAENTITPIDANASANARTVSTSLLDSSDVGSIISSFANIKDLQLLETLYNYEESKSNRKEVLEAINKQYESLASNEVTSNSKKGKK